MKSNPFDIAESFIQSHFPNSEVAILAGSVVRGEGTPKSDLDIVIIQESEEMMSRQCYLYKGWPIEAFVYNQSSFETFFEGDCMLGNPSLVRMCAEGHILVESKLATNIKQKAKSRLIEGPLEWTEDQIDHARYQITDLLDDFIGSSCEKESIFIVNKLADHLHEFILRTNGQWTGEGKWLIRSFKNYNESLCDEFFQVFNMYYKMREKNEVVQYIDQILAPHGGRLFDGYRQ